MHCCNDKVNTSPNIPKFWQIVSSGLPVERHVAKHVRHDAQGALIGLIRLHVQLTRKARPKRLRGRHDDAEFRALVTSLKAIEAEAGDDYGPSLACIARDAIEAEADRRCRCREARVAEVVARVTGASMFSELNVAGRCPPCRDAPPGMDGGMSAPYRYPAVRRGGASDRSALRRKQRADDAQ